MADSLVYEDSVEQAPGRRLHLTPVVFMAVVVAFVAIVGVSLARVGRSQPTSGLAPDFTLRTFESETFNLAEQQGNVVIVNFWASWCVPCRDEAPILQDVWERYRDRGVVLVGVAYLDVERDALAFIDEFDVTYPNGLDMGKVISARYRIKGVPETFVVDQQGNIVDFYIGPAAEGQLDALLDDLLDV